MGNHPDFVVHVPAIMFNPGRLVCDIQSLLQSRVVRGNTGRAGVLVALQCLDAAKGEHVTPGRDDEIRPEADGPGDRCGFDQLAGCDDTHAALQVMPDECISQHRQAFAQWQPHVIDQALRCGTGAAVRTVDGYKVWRRLDTPVDDFPAEILNE